MSNTFKILKLDILLFADPTQGTISPADNQAILDIIGLHLRQN